MNSIRPTYIVLCLTCLHSEAAPDDGSSANEIADEHIDKWPTHEVAILKADVMRRED